MSGGRSGDGGGMWAILLCDPGVGLDFLRIGVCFCGWGEESGFPLLLVVK